MTKKLSLALVVAVVLVFALAGVAQARGSMSTAVFMADLKPLNQSGVGGKATFVLKGATLHVIVTARGLESGKQHMQEIRGNRDGSKAVCPPPSADVNGDGIISPAEGLSFYGPVLLPLAPYPMARGRGVVTYNHTFRNKQFDVLDLANTPLTNRVIVLHGMTLAGPYDAGAYDPTVPIACGVIRRVPASWAP